MLTAKQHTIINKFPNLIAGCCKLDDYARLGLDTAEQLLMVESAAIFSKENNELKLLSFRGLPSGINNAILAWGKCLDGLVAETWQAKVVDDAHPDQHAVCSLNGRKMNALVAVPLVSRGRILGLLVAISCQNRVFSGEEVYMLGTLGNQLGMAMENAILLSKQSVIAAKLKASEKQFQELFEKTSDIIWVEDLEGNIISANTSCAQIMDIEHERLLEKNIREFIPEGGVKAAVRIRHTLLDGVAGEEHYDQVIISRFGIKKVLKMSTNSMDLEGVQGFQHIAKDITEERRMHENLRYYVQQVTRAQEEERARISRELHDSTAQSLIAVLHQVETFLGGTKYLKIVDYRYLCNIVEQIKSTLQEVRHFSRNLRPSILDDLGLLPALEWFTEELRRTHSLTTTFRIVGNEMRFFSEVEVALFRVVQEALNNIIRHGEAEGAFVSFRFSKDVVMLTIRDNGKGFAVPTNFSDLPRQGKLGLTGMIERVRLIGGNIMISSSPGKGTTIKIEIPTVIVTPNEYTV
jgi:PAS domain S-box-containing protein